MFFFFSREKKAPHSAEHKNIKLFHYDSLNLFQKYLSSNLFFFFLFILNIIIILCGRSCNHDYFFREHY